MVGQTFTYLIGPDSSALLFNSKNDQLNAEEVYSNLTTPVFGKGVAYDVPNPVSCIDCSTSNPHILHIKILSLVNSTQLNLDTVCPFIGFPILGMGYSV